jgi:drug/metabolite transporter, DME family
MSHSNARLLALVAAVLFSTGGAAIKTGAFSAAQVSCARSGIAALVLLAWMRGGFEPSGRVLGIGAAYGLVLTLFVASTKLTTAANAIFLQATAPLYIVALSPWLLGERVRRREIAYMVALGIGLLICFGGQRSATAIASDPRLGNVLATVSSLAWAFTLIGLRWAQRDARNVGVSAVVAGNLIAFLIALPFAWPFPVASGVEWGTLLYLGVIQIGLAYICLTTAMRELPALEVSLLLLIEPVLNPLWTWLVRGEEPGLWVLVGGIVIVLATALKGVFDARSVQVR